MEEQKQQECTAQTQELLELGASTTKSSRGNIYTLTIIGQIEGHQVLPETVKTTKYEHVIPLLAAVEESEEIDGLLLLLNTVGGDIEAGLAIAELIAGMKKPTVSLVLGGGHSIGIPLAVSAKRAIIAPRASMTVHPVRMTGLVVGAPQTYHYFDQIHNEVEKMVTEFDDLDIKVAVMGCVVNGPGEAKEADIGIAGGKGEGLLIKKGQVVRKLPESELLSTLREELAHWNDKADE